jgi:ABC-type antimicrobial peptide transport system permease subunit
MLETVQNMGWAVIFCLLGGLVGMILVLWAAVLVPRVVDRLTPRMDEQREIARGNMAVAEYFGRVVAAAIIGVSIVVAAAVLGGIMAALH